VYTEQPAKTSNSSRARAESRKRLLATCERGRQHSEPEAGEVHWMVFLPHDGMCHNGGQPGHTQTICFNNGSSELGPLAHAISKSHEGMCACWDRLKT
jgi:hypothetical protein